MGVSVFYKGQYYFATHVNGVVIDDSISPIGPRSETDMYRE